MSFKGNEGLRYAKDRYQYTTDEVLEIQKCIQDPVYFISTYVKIVNLNEEQLVLFKPRDYQIELLNLVLNNRFTIAKWARQSGKSTIVSAILLYLILFNANYRILIVAHMHNKAKEVLEVAKQMYELLPQFLQHGILSWGKASIHLGNGSMLKTAGTSGSSGRGGTYNMIYLDEFAHVMPHLAEEFFKSVMPVISSGKQTKVVITSTPRGLNMFYRLWNDSENGKNEYHRSEINWWDPPGRDEAWKQREIEANGIDYFRQEYASEFIGSSDTLISGDKLRALVYSKPLIVAPNVMVYAEPQKGRMYAITVDIGEGIGLDYSVVMCFDITKTPYEVVCVFRSNATTSMQMPGVIYSMGRHYNGAMVLIETASEGSQVANILHYDMEYPNVIMTSTAKSEQKISGGFGDKSRFGLKMTKSVKMTGCSILKTLIENDQLIINDATLLNEFYHFTKHGMTFEADEGHDDHVMCCVSFAWLVDQGYIRDLSNVDLRKQVAMDYQKELEDSCAPLMISGNFDPIEAEIAETRQSWNGDPIPNPDMQELIDKFYNRN